MSEVAIRGLKRELGEKMHIVSGERRDREEVAGKNMSLVSSQARHCEKGLLH